MDTSLADSADPLPDQENADPTRVKGAAVHISPPKGDAAERAVLSPTRLSPTSGSPSPRSGGCGMTTISTPLVRTGGTKTAERAWDRLRMPRSSTEIRGSTTIPHVVKISGLAIFTMVKISGLA